MRARGWRALRLLLARRFGRYNKWDSCRRRGVRLAHQPWKPCAGQGTRVSAATMNPPCGRCNKPVYPTEKINCLDKVRQVIHTRSDLCKAPGRFLEVCFIKALDFGCITLSMSRLRPGGHAHFVAKHPDRHRRGVLGLPKPGKSSWFLQN